VEVVGVGVDLLLLPGGGCNSLGRSESGLGAERSLGHGEQLGLDDGDVVEERRTGASGLPGALHRVQLGVLLGVRRGHHLAATETQLK
jgi:hypothetical protein